MMDPGYRRHCSIANFLSEGWSAAVLRKVHVDIPSGGLAEVVVEREVYPWDQRCQSHVVWSKTGRGLQDLLRCW